MRSSASIVSARFSKRDAALLLRDQALCEVGQALAFGRELLAALMGEALELVGAGGLGREPRLEIRDGDAPGVEVAARRRAQALDLGIGGVAGGETLLGGGKRGAGRGEVGVRGVGARPGRCKLVEGLPMRRLDGAGGIARRPERLGRGGGGRLRLSKRSRVPASSFSSSTMRLSRAMRSFSSASIRTARRPSSSMSRCFSESASSALRSSRR